jgi:DNA-binding YbaB/EbfC family protein
MKGGMQNIMRQAQQMQRKMQKIQEELSNLEVEASAGGGMVTVRVNCQHKVLDVKIDPEIANTEDLDMLQDLIVAAVNEAHRLAEQKHKEEMEKVVPAGMMNNLGLF